MPEPIRNTGGFLGLHLHLYFSSGLQLILRECLSLATIPSKYNAAKYAGVSAAESIPGVGTAINIAVTSRDIIHGQQEYNACMAGD
jgi:hypothetical protein